MYPKNMIIIIYNVFISLINNFLALNTYKGLEKRIVKSMTFKTNKSKIKNFKTNKYFCLDYKYIINKYLCY